MDLNNVKTALKKTDVQVYLVVLLGVFLVFVYLAAWNDVGSNFISIFGAATFVIAIFPLLAKICMKGRAISAVICFVLVFIWAMILRLWHPNNEWVSGTVETTIFALAVIALVILINGPSEA